MMSVVLGEVLGVGPWIGLFWVPSHAGNWAHNEKPAQSMNHTGHTHRQLQSRVFRAWGQGCLCSPDHP